MSNAPSVERDRAMTRDLTKRDGTCYSYGRREIVLFVYRSVFAMMPYVLNSLGSLRCCRIPVRDAQWGGYTQFQPLHLWTQSKILCIQRLNIGYSRGSKFTNRPLRKQPSAVAAASALLAAITSLVIGPKSKGRSSPASVTL